MPSFRYKALSPDGRPASGAIEAPAGPDAARLIAQRAWATLLSDGPAVDEALPVYAAAWKSQKVLFAVEYIRRAIRDGNALHVALTEARWKWQAM